MEYTNVFKCVSVVKGRENSVFCAEFNGSKESTLFAIVHAHNFSDQMQVIELSKFQSLSDISRIQPFKIKYFEIKIQEKNA